MQDPSNLTTPTPHRFRHASNWPPLLTLAGSAVAAVMLIQVGLALADDGATRLPASTTSPVLKTTSNAR